VIELRDKRVVVVGLGSSGVAAARLCLARGAAVTVTDSKDEAGVGPVVRELAGAGAELALGGHSRAHLERADLIVVSPGVPSFPELARAEQAGVPVIGEVELSTRALQKDAPIVAVGGTNGKSTTTTLIGEILEKQGLHVFVGGNLGEPLAAHADEPWDAIVLEVSSFQMERVQQFRPRVALLLNITADHLDRYPDVNAYADAKGNGFARQTSEDVAIVPTDDPRCEQQARRGAGRIVTFGPGGDLDVTHDDIVDRRSGASWPLRNIALQGGHNARNAAAALAAVAELGAGVELCREVLTTFRGLPHRMALVRELEDVRFYDDSKGTNVGASVTALLGLRERRAVLIAGGRDKGGSYEPLVDALRTKGRAVVLIGEASARIAAVIGDAVPVHRVATLHDAVSLSRQLAAPGDAVLLSPACSSYDMFKDYKHRGDEFVREVQSLGSGSRP